MIHTGGDDGSWFFIAGGVEVNKIGVEQLFVDLFIVTDECGAHVLELHSAGFVQSREQYIEGSDAVTPEFGLSGWHAEWMEAGIGRFFADQPEYRLNSIHDLLVGARIMVGLEVCLS